MQHWKLCAFTAAILSVLTLVSCSKDPFAVDILARGEGGAEIVGDALQKIPYGEDASFAVTLPAGESIVQVFVDDTLTENYLYENGTLTLPGVTAPGTVRIVAGDPGKKVYWETQVMSKYGGSVSSNVPEGAVAFGSMVTMKAVPNDGAVFLGWTERYSLESGGKLLTEEEQVTVEVDDFSFYIANFDASGVPREEEKKPASAPVVRGENTYTIYYHVNGGNLLADDKVAVETTFDTSYWSMPVAREDDGLLNRDGHILLGYSLNQEGTGELIRPGHKYRLPTEEKTYTLYCVWQEETDPAQFLVTETENNSVRIDQYTGKDSVVYIPRKIDGKWVKQIAPGAFTGNETLTEVHISSGITTVADGAFKDCPALTTITVYDNLQNVSDASFAGSPVKTMRLCAATTPRYVDSYINFSIKFERLMLGEGGPRIVIVAGSSKYWGLDSLLMESLVDDAYTVVNYGTSVGMNIMFFLEAVSSYLTEDDVLVFAPEQYGVNAYHSTGNPELPSTTFQGIASSYNLMERVDITHFEKVFDAFSEFTHGRMQMSDARWDSYSHLIDRTGAYTNSRTDYNAEDYYGGTLGTFRFDSEAFPAQYLPNLNRALDGAAEKGAAVLFSFPPHNRLAVMPRFRSAKALESYMEFLDESIHATRISDLNNYIHEPKYFDDSDYHLGVEGRGIHTRQLTEDLLASGAVKGK